MTNLREEIRLTIDAALKRAVQERGVFDVYSAAVKIGETFLNSEVRIDDIIDYILAHLGGIEAVEISPPVLIVDIFFPVDADEEIIGGNVPSPNREDDSPHDKSRVRAMSDRHYRTQIRNARMRIDASFVTIEESAPLLELHRPSPLTKLAKAPGGSSLTPPNPRGRRGE